MNLPTITRCLALMEEYDMLENIREHSLMVASVAMTILDGLTLPAEQLPERDLIVAGALLHDIAKTKCLEEDCNHAEVGKTICRDEGYPEIGEIVCEHVILHSFSHERYENGVFSGKDIIYYSDKRVNHTRVVTLDQRLTYIMDRYGNNDVKCHALIEKNFQKCVDLENYIFTHMRFLPSELPLYVSPLSAGMVG
jgi:uncharacterized protein